MRPPPIPLATDRQQEVIRHTRAWVARASRRDRRPLPAPAVRFDLGGRAAGMYRRQGRQCWIRYNPHLFARDYAHHLAVTVPHEVAHYVTDLRFGLSRIRPHGPEWRAVMEEFGVEARAGGDWDLSGLPVRRERRHPYHCDCREHRLTTRRHRRIARGRWRYSCRECGAPLRPGPFNPPSPA